MGLFLEGKYARLNGPKRSSTFEDREVRRHAQTGGHLGPDKGGTVSNQCREGSWGGYGARSALLSARWKVLESVCTLMARFLKWGTLR